MDREAVEGGARPIRDQQEQVTTRKHHPHGTDNVLPDLGFDDAQEPTSKAALAPKLNELLGQRGLVAATVAVTSPCETVRPNARAVR